MSYLFGFSGRINRAKIWLFFLICLVVDIAIGALAAYGFDWSETVKSFVAAAKEMTPGQQLDFTKVAGPKMAGAHSYGALATMAALWLMLMYVGLAIFVKRLHDRNKSAWWLLLYWLLPMALQIYSYATAPSFGAALMNIRTPLGYAAYGIAMLISLWVFVELYIFRGTRGENRFGPDPLA